MGLITNHNGQYSKSKIAFWISLAMIFVVLIATTFFGKTVDLPMYGLLALVFVIIFLDRRNSRSTSITFAGMAIQQEYSEEKGEEENGD